MLEILVREAPLCCSSAKTLICVDRGEMDLGIKNFHSHVQHSAVEPTNVALLSMQGLIRQTFKEQGPTGNGDSREAFLFIV